MEKIVAVVLSDKHYILNFYECAFGVFYPGTHTLVYWDPYSPITEEFIHNKIEGAPTRLVVLVPDPDVPLTNYWAKHKIAEKNRKTIFDYGHTPMPITTLPREEAEEEVKQEDMMNSVLTNFKYLNEALEAKIIFKNAITKGEDSEEEDDDME